MKISKSLDSIVLIYFLVNICILVSIFMFNIKFFFFFYCFAINYQARKSLGQFQLLRKILTLPEESTKKKIALSRN